MTTDHDDGGGDLTFESLEPARVPVTIAGQAYSLREATEADYAAYRDAQAKATRFGADGKPAGVANITQADAMFLGRCLLGPDGKPVGAQALAAWPASVTRKLFKRLTRVSGMDDEAKAAPANDDGQPPRAAAGEALAAKNGHASAPTAGTSA